MSTRFWTGSAALIGGSAILGLTMGSFATRLPPREVISYASTTSDERDDSLSAVSSEPDHGPGEIICKGCGPTLAERRMAADNPGWDPDGMIDGPDDPVAADYDAQDVTVPAPSAPSATHRLPANIQRFADGEEGASPVASSPAIMTTTASGAPPI